MHPPLLPPIAGHPIVSHTISPTVSIVLLCTSTASPLPSSQIVMAFQAANPVPSIVSPSLQMSFPGMSLAMGPSFVLALLNNSDTDAGLVEVPVEAAIAEQPTHEFSLAHTDVSDSESI